MSLKFFIDDVAVDAAVIDQGTVEQALHKVQSELSAAGKLVVSLKCDGCEVPSDALAATLDKPVTAFARLEVFTSTKETLVIEAMNQAAVSLDEAEAECRRIAGLLTEGKTADGIRALGDCLGAWQQIHDAVSKSIRMLNVDLGTSVAEGDRLAELIVRPREVLLQIKQALESQDHVLLADILQYELEEVTQQWHLVVDLVRGKALAEGAGTA